MSLSKSKYTLDQYQCLMQASNMKIIIIDKLPTLLPKKIVKLSLTNNLISQLQNINQFVNLCELDITHNRIKDGMELLKLNSLKKLNRIRINGNPFLRQPLDEQVLEFILSKDTDIQILSGDALHTIKELEEGELKVVFLQNYLKKINFHGELRSKKMSNTSSNDYDPDYENEGERMYDSRENRKNMDKIMPQLYTIIQDPKLKSEIKKETIKLKKFNKLSFEQAMELRKKKQENQVNHLLKDIMELIEDHEVQQLRQRETLKSSRRTPSIQINDSDNFYSFHINQQKQQQEQEKEEDKDLLSVSMKRPRRYRETETRRQTPKSTRSTKRQTIRETLRQKQRQKSTKRSKKETLRSLQREQQDQYNQRQSQYHKLQLQQLYELQHQESIRSINTTTNRNQNYENFYYNNLTKYNPSFAMLYSKIDRLGEEQKNVLIQALSKDHKLKTIQLYKHIERVKQMQQQLRQRSIEFVREKNELILQIKEQQEISELKNQYLSRSQKQNVRLNDILNSLSGQIQSLRQSNKEYKKENTDLIQQYNIISYNYEQVHNFKQHILNAEQLQEKIVEKREQKIRRKYLNKVNERAYLYAQVQRLRKQNMMKHQTKLLNTTWHVLKKYMIKNIIINIRVEEHNAKITKKCFNLLKTNRIQEKVIQNKQKQLLKYICTKRIGSAINGYRKLKENRNQNKLKQYWADCHYVKVTMYRLMNRVKEQRQIRNRITNNKLKRKYFNTINQHKLSMINKDDQLNKTINKMKMMVFYRQLRYNHQQLQNNRTYKNINNKFVTMFQGMLRNKRKKEKIQHCMSVYKNSKCNKKKVLQFKKLRLKDNLNKLVQFRINAIKGKEIKENKQMVVGRIIQKNAIRFMKTSMRKRRLKFTMLLVRLEKGKREIELQVNRRQYQLQNNRNVNRIRQFFHFMTKFNYRAKINKEQLKQQGAYKEAKEILQCIKEAQNQKIQHLIKQKENNTVSLKEQIIKMKLQYDTQIKLQQNDHIDNIEHIKVLTSQVQLLSEKEQDLLQEKLSMLEEMAQKEKSYQHKDVQMTTLMSENQKYKVKYNQLLKKYQQSLNLIERSYEDSWRSPTKTKRKDQVRAIYNKTAYKEERQSNTARKETLPIFSNQVITQKETQSPNKQFYSLNSHNMF